MRILFCILFTVSLLFRPSSAFARFNPLEVPNNKYGIHSIDTNDLSLVRDLVNSQGGDWGYVTLVISEREMNREHWQDVFNRMRRLHLIPIVRIATSVTDDYWLIPQQDAADRWAAFLNSLNWPIENRYVVVFNEPNHAKEWGMKIDPKGYAETFVTFAKKLKETSDDFFVLPAGLDVSADNSSYSMDAREYLATMIDANHEVLDLMDGLSSHSYPNPNFSGSPSDSGRGTLFSYLWELETLRSFGLTRTLPVFITETGWQHSSGKAYDPSLLSPQTVAGYITQAASGAWSNRHIVAITPFIFNYQDYPFDHFSWKMLGSNSFYDHFFAYQRIEKVSGLPKQHHAYTVRVPAIPQSLVSQSSYTLKGVVENIGQHIIDASAGYSIHATSNPAGFTFLVEPPDRTEPGERMNVVIHAQTPKTPGEYKIEVNLVANKEILLLEEREVSVVPPPSMKVSTQLGWRKDNSCRDAVALIYGLDNALVQKIPNVELRDGAALVGNLTNIVPNTVYRIVLLCPYYLPKQTFQSLSIYETPVSLGRMLPLDFNKDGMLTYHDIQALLRLQPKFVAGLFANF